MTSLVELHDLVRDDVPAVAAHGLEAARRAGLAQRVVAQQALEPGGQGTGVAGRHQQPLDAVAHDVAVALDVGGQHGGVGGHGFEQTMPNDSLPSDGAQKTSASW